MVRPVPGSQVTALTDPYRVTVTPSTRYAANPGDLGPGGNWFGPALPPAPIAPPEVAGRAFDYPVGYNLNTQPRAYESLTFAALRGLADGYDLLRMLIETRKDQMERLTWTIREKKRAGQKPKLRAEDARVIKVNEFFQRPDGVTDWGPWLRMLLEDMFVIDAPTLFCRRARGGQLLGLEVIDGATIKRVIDASGRTPTFPLPAYQQVLKGLPAVNYTAKDLLYRPRNPRVSRVYGYSPVEQIIMTVNIALRRQVFQLQYYTEGNVPEALIGVPETWSPDQIKDFQTWWDSLMEGNTAQRRHAKFIPSGVAKTYVATKEPELKSPFDEWLARVCCFAFSISPTPFVAQVNRAVADTERERSLEEGLVPIQQWVKGGVDSVLAGELGCPDLEFAWEEEEALSPSEQKEVIIGYIDRGVLTIDEARKRIGEEPYPDGRGAEPMVYTASGYVPLDPIERPDPAEVEDQGDDETIDGTAAVAPTTAEGEEEEGTEPVKGTAFLVRPRRLAKFVCDARARVLKAAGGKKKLRASSPRRALVRTVEKNLARTVAVTLRGLAPNVGAQVREALTRLVKASTKGPARRVATDLDLHLLVTMAADVKDDLAEVATDSGKRVVAQLGVDDPTDLFDQVSERAARFAENRAAELVGKRRLKNGKLVDNPNAKYNIDQSTRDLVRQAIANGLEAGQTTTEIADDIEDIKGETGSRLFGEQRAKLIAHTEVANANSEGDLEGMRTARDELDLKVMKAWLIDGNPCAICIENGEAGYIDIDEDFPSGDQRPLAHPNCECALLSTVEE